MGYTQQCILSSDGRLYPILPESRSRGHEIHIVRSELNARFADAVNAAHKYLLGLKYLLPLAKHQDGP